MSRDPDLQILILALAADCAMAAPAANQNARRLCDAVFSRARNAMGTPGANLPAQLPVCAQLPSALSRAAIGPFRATAQALSRLAPRLTWTRRALASPADQPFWDGHANAMLLGAGGLESRADLWIGLSLLAPDVTYPDHDHGPEEAYLPLSPGQWFNTATGWVDPQGRGLIYNPPGITHAMRAAPDAALLALWLLPL